MAQALGPSLPNMILALTVTYWPWFTVIVAAETRAVKKAIFVEATEALGVGPTRILACHVLPNVLSPIIVRSTLSMGITIMTAAVLGFLGMGAQPPAPEWGAMIAEARLYLPDAW
jgi:peptide/nickel transport system permease protein